MKKLFCIFLSTFILCTSILCLNSKQVYCNEYIKVSEAESERVYNYIHKDITDIGNKVDFLFKAIVTSKQSKSKEELNEYLKDIKFLQSQIGYLSQNMKNDYKTLTLSATDSQALLFEIIVASVYDLTLFQLTEYINSTTPEDEYSISIKLFKSISHAKDHIEDIKQMVPLKPSSNK